MSTERYRYRLKYHWTSEMGQSQTKGGVGNILAAIDELKLQTGDFLYMDLLSNASFMGTDEDGLQVPPV